MRISATLILLLFLVPDETEDLIARYHALKEGAVEEKLAVLDRLGADPADEAERFLKFVLDKAKEEKIRALAFVLWARRQSGEMVKAYLDSQRSSSFFTELLPLVAKLDRFDGLAYVEDLYGQDKSRAFKRELNLAVAAHDTDEAYRFLKLRWAGCDNFREALDLLPAILSMEQAQNVEFFRGLMKSRYPFARYEGAARLLREDTKAVVQEVADFLNRETHPGVRSAVIDALPRFRSREVARVLIDATSSQPRERLYEIVDSLCEIPANQLRLTVPPDWYMVVDPSAYQVVALAFSRHEELYESLDKSELDLLKKGMRHFDPDVSLTSAVSFSRLVKYSGEAEQILKKRLEAGTVDDRWEALHTIQCFRISDAMVKERVLKLTGSSKRTMKIKAAEVLSALGAEELRAVLRFYFSSNDDLLHIAAIKALGRLGGEASVEMLLDRMKKEKGRARYEAVYALNEITGRDFGPDRGLWMRWWDNRSEAFLSPPDKKSLWFPERSEESRYTTFYGLYVEAHRIVYVLDVSGSMAGLRIRQLRDELKRSINIMTGEHAVNFITFSDSVRKWQKGLAPMGEKKNRERALKFVDRLVAGGGTNFHDGLMEGLEEEEASAVIVLSDGQPTVGRVVNTEAILKSAMRLNRDVQMRIHTVAIGEADRAFMMRLALSSGGTFKSIR